jgi:hypothetical protein
MRLFFTGLVAAAALSFSAPARAECNCVSVAADVFASVQAEVMKADALYARGDFSGALAIYAKAYEASKDAVLLYAQGMAHWQLGATARAKASFEAYLKAGGTLAYKERAQAHLKQLGGGLVAGAGGAIGAVGGLGGRAVGAVAHGGGDLVGTGAGVAGAGVGAVGTGVGVVGGVATDVTPKKPGRTVGIVLGVVAIAAIGAVGIHSIAAGVSEDIELDPKFDLGLGISGVAVGISAIYVAGITTAAATVPTCSVATLPKGKPIVAPYATANGGGITAALSF